MSYYKTIREKGYLMVGYTFVKSLGLNNAVVLEQLHTEFNFARRNHHLNNDEYFLTNITLLAITLNLTEETVLQAILKLEELNLIKTTKIINNVLCVYIDEFEIIDFVKTAETKNRYKHWDTYLKLVQPTIYLTDY